MIWIWLISGIFLLFLFVLLSSVKIRIHYSHNDQDDHLTIKVKALFGLIRFKYAVPVLQWGKHGIMALTGKAINKSANANLQETEITKDNVDAFFERAKAIIEHTVHFKQLVKAVIVHVKCTEFHWITRIGLGEAPETAIAAGTVWAIKTSVLSYLFKFMHLAANPSVSVQPQYNRFQFDTEIKTVMAIKMYRVLAGGVVLVIRIVRARGGIRTWRKVLSGS
jgi:hypothetical protein